MKVCLKKIVGTLAITLTVAAISAASASAMITGEGRIWESNPCDPQLEGRSFQAGYGAVEKSGNAPRVFPLTFVDRLGMEQEGGNRFDIVKLYNHFPSYYESGHIVKRICEQNRMILHKNIRGTFFYLLVQPAGSDWKKPDLNELQGVRQTAPVVRQTAPVVRQTAPVVRRTAPVVRRTAPVVRQTARKAITLPSGMNVIVPKKGDERGMRILEQGMSFRDINALRNAFVSQ